MTTKALPILMYHHISPNPGLVTLSPATFRAQIAALAQAGWHTGGSAEVERFLRGEPLPKKTCVITFDDGYLDNYVHAHPVLLEFGLHASLFVVTGWLGDGPDRTGSLPTPNHDECKRQIAVGNADSVMLRWSEVEIMAAAGTFEFHSHTHTHTRWDRQVVDQNERDIRLGEDLAHSRDTMIKRLGTCSRHMCWPQGYYDANYQRVAVSCGFDHLYTTERRINTQSSPKLRIGRIDTKERPGSWLLNRLGMYSRPWLGNMYLKLR